MRNGSVPILALLAVLYGSTEAQGSATPVRGQEQNATVQARELEAHLLAPCCWRETLAAHQSQLASALRQEIERRLAGGESVDHLEADLVARHGPGIRAQLPDKLGYLIGLFAVGFGFFFLSMIAKSSSPAEEEMVPAWLTRSQQRPRADQQQYEALLDDDLDRDMA
jgi:cytochrome c-type biogenesis protein CcmH/NrfF